MTRQQFTTLSQDKQLRTLLLRGSFIGERKEDNMEVLLFQLDRCYVEVFFNLDCDDVLYTRSFESQDELQPYLEHINLNDVL